MKTILLCTDFSVAAKNAGNFAVELAKLFRSKLLLLNVCQIPTGGYDMMPGFDVLSGLAENSEKSLLELKSEIITIYPELDIETLSRTGSVVNITEQVCKDFSVGLIVMGLVSDVGILKEQLIGSTSLDVARNLQVPLFIIPESCKYKPVKKISFAWNLNSKDNLNLAYKARYFCHAFSAELEVVNIENSSEESTFPRAQKISFLESQFKNLKHETLIIDDEKPIQALEEYFKWYPTDVILINPEKHGILHAIFHKSVTQELAFHMNTPLLIIH